MSLNKTINNLEIIISDSTSEEKDSKHKQTLNKKLKKIDELKKQIENITNAVDIAKKLYVEHIVEEEKNLFVAKEKLIVKLFERFQQKSFTLWQKEVIQEKLNENLRFLSSKGYLSEELSVVQEKLMKIVNDSMSDEEKEYANDLAKEFIKGMGIDIDEEDFDFTDPNFSQKFQEDYINQHAKSEQQEKHAQQQNKTQNTDKEFQKLYRLLVKKVHPDLVTNKEEKEQREDLMKKLSLVWEKRDYYQLLILKKEIDKDDSIEVELDEAQVTSLVSQLETEIKGLQHQKYVMKEKDPETAFYYNVFYAKSEKGVLKKINDFKVQLGHYMEETEEEFLLLKTQKSTKSFLESIYNDREHMFSGFFNDFD